MDEPNERVVPISGTVDEALLLRAIRADSARALMRKRIVAAMVGTLSLIPPVTGWIQGKDAAAHHFVVIVLCALYVLYLERRLRTTARRVLAASRQEGIVYSGTVTEESLAIASAQESTRIPWDEIQRTLIRSDIVLLYQSGGFNMLARELFESDADWETFVGWARTKVASPNEPVLTPAFRSLLVWFAVFLVLVVLWWLLITRRNPVPGGGGLQTGLARTRSRGRHPARSVHRHWPSP